MTALRTLIFGLLLGWLPTVAAANCTNLRTAVIPDAQIANIAGVQRGLQTALGDENSLLADNRLGAYTRVRLVDFCRAFPVPTDVDIVAGTLALAQHYGTLATQAPDWNQIASGTSFADRLLPGDEIPLNAEILRVIGTPATIAEGLQGQTGATDCATVAYSSLPATAQTGQLVLNGLDPDLWPDAASTCSQLDLRGGADSTAQVLSTLGALEAGLAGSVHQLLTPDFALWFGEDIADRGPRLVGNSAAVIALVIEYRGENRAGALRDFNAIYQDLPASCDHGGGGQVTDYISFDQAAFDGLVAPVDVNGLLGELAGQSFESGDALTAAIMTQLTGQVSDCTRDQVLLALNSPENFGQAFTLNAEKTANLALADSIGESAALIEPFVGLSTTSRGALLSAIRGTLQSATGAEIDAQVEAAADVLASASEPVSQSFDTLPEGVPPFAELPQSPTIGVTEATDSAITATVTDPEFRDTLLGADYQPAPNPEVLKSDVRRLLSPVAADRVATIVNRAMVQLQPAVDTSWTLTDTLSAAIAAAPATQGVPDAAQTEDINAALTALIGVEYPTARLFDAAVAPIATGPIANDIRASATISADNVNDDFDTNIALPDCGCAGRRDDNSLVYGFMPFWLAPPAAGASEAPPAEEAEEENPAPPGRLIDFGLVNRAAFYGLEFTVNEDGNLALHNETAWTAGRRDFVNAAHQHRAKADLAITLTGWDSWSDVQIATAVQNITAMTAPFARTDSTDLRSLWAAFPTILDAPQPDGVTFVINGYDGTQRSVPGIERLTSLITLLQPALAARNQTINLAFDLNIADTRGDHPVFSDLETLLTGAKPLVDYVLIFLERPTTDTKKTLRARMENGVFRGIDRARVLRRIIPVVPPAGHEHVLQGQAANAPLGSAPPGPFSQLTDDLVYFQDNFAGIGFWPAPDPSGSETDAINAIFQEQWFKPIMPEFLASFEADAERACTFICPNRSYFAAAMLLIFLVTAGVIWRSFYSGFMDKVAFKFGVAWIGSGLIFVGLLALTICDSGATVPPFLLLATIVLMVLLILFHIYQGAKNGPKP